VIILSNNPAGTVIVGDLKNPDKWYEEVITNPFKLGQAEKVNKLDYTQFIAELEIKSKNKTDVRVLI
jgi:hypothetical protein